MTDLLRHPGAFAGLDEDVRDVILRRILTRILVLAGSDPEWRPTLKACLPPLSRKAHGTILERLEWWRRLGWEV